MATDGPTPPPCDDEIYKKGETVCVLVGPANAIEQWVKAVAEKANARVDWHYFGGRAVVLHLGTLDSKYRALEAINELRGDLAVPTHILHVATD